MIEQGRVVLCPMCGDDLVVADSPLYMEYRTDVTAQCRWYLCELCNHSWKEDLSVKEGGAEEYVKYLQEKGYISGVQMQEQEGSKAQGK